MRSLKFALAALAATVALGAAQAEPVKIRMAWVAPVSNWASIVLEKKDLAKHIGKSYTLEAIRFAGTPPMITAIANGELEVANLAYSTFPLAVQNANIDDLRVIADEFQDGVEGYATNELAVLKDSPIKKIEDLKGKVIATNAAGSAVDIASRAMLRKHGLEDKRDYTIVEAPFPTMKAMLKEKKADLAPYVLPFSFDPELKQIARPLFSSKDAIGVSQFIIWAARKSFIDKNRAAMVDFMEDMLHHRALVHGPEEPQGGHRDRRQDDQGAAGAVRLAVHQEGLLPQSGHAAGPRRAAGQHRPDAPARLHQGAARREEIHRPEPRPGSGQAPEVSVTPSRANGLKTGPGDAPSPGLFH